MDDHQFKDGVKAAFPIVLGYLPVGMAFGILARKAGLTTLEVALMSLLVYAGASQFLAIEMILKGMAWFPIVIATFFINLRHFLMSSNLSLFLNKVRLSFLSLLSAQLTDESFAIAISNLPKAKNKPSYLFGLQITSHLAWVGGSVGGAFFGPLIKSSEYGLPFALPALFICLLVSQIKSIHHFWMMVVAGVSSLLFRWVFPGNWYILLAALLTSGTGVVIEMVKNQFNSLPLNGEGEGRGEKSVQS
ncbi:MAG: AzlC family ABC transporter permease [Thermodesulfobacteriota bacterium]